MKQPILLVIASFLGSFTFSQEMHEQNKGVAESEIRTLLGKLNTAMQKHDRKALEEIYADDFLFIHGLGYIDNKTVQINEIMESDSVPLVPILPFEQFYVYNNVAVLRALYKRPGARAALMSTSIYAKKEGKWQILQVQSTTQQPDRKLTKLDGSILDSYTGKYVQSDSSYTIITRFNDELIAKRGTLAKRTLASVSDTQFFDKSGSRFTFNKDANNKITHFILLFPTGQEIKWNKVE